MKNHKISKEFIAAILVTGSFILGIFLARNCSNVNVSSNLESQPKHVIQSLCNFEYLIGGPIGAMGMLLCITISFIGLIFWLATNFSSHKSSRGGKLAFYFFMAAVAIFFTAATIRSLIIYGILS